MYIYTTTLICYVNTEIKLPINFIMRRILNMKKIKQKKQKERRKLN